LPDPRDSPPLPRASQPGVSWSDLTDSLTWPRLLAAPRLARRPANIVLGMLAVVCIIAADRLPALWNPSGGGALSAYALLAAEHLRALAAGVLKLDAHAAADALGQLFFKIPGGLIKAAPFSTAFTFAFGIIGVSLFTGAICRGVALIIGGERPRSPLTMLRFAATRWLSLAAAPLVPIMLFYAAALATMSVGWVGLSLSGVQVIGGAAFFVELLLALFAVLMVICIFIGGPLLLPAVACEGTDAIDAGQRVLSYAWGRPDRLLVYLLILIARGVISVGLFILVAKLTSLIALAAATLWLPEGIAADIRQGFASDPLSGWSRRATVSLVHFWVNVPMVIAAGYAMSYVCASGTLAYLAMRRLVDGQDMGEVWIEPAAPATRADDAGGEEGGNE